MHLSIHNPFNLCKFYLRKELHGDNTMCRQFNLLNFLSADPHAPPQNIQSSVTGSRTVVISWDPPLFEDQNGIIAYYLLLISEEQFNVSDRVINTTSDASTYTVTELEEYDDYTCRVAAATRIGPGPYSAPIEFSTPQDGI